jgi:hypothetical protein
MNLTPVVLATPATVASGDAFLLASDRICECVTETELEIELSKALTPADWLRTIEFRMRSKAMEPPGNYAAVAVMVP